MNKCTTLRKRWVQKPAIKSRRTCWLFKASTPTPGQRKWSLRAGKAYYTEMLQAQLRLSFSPFYTPFFSPPSFLLQWHILASAPIFARNRLSLECRSYTREIEKNDSREEHATHSKWSQFVCSRRDDRLSLCDTFANICSYFFLFKQPSLIFWRAKS